MTRFSRLIFSRTKSCLSVAVMLGLLGCGNPTQMETVSPTVSSKLQGLGDVIDPAAMIMMNGSYGLGCTRPANQGNLWSLPVGGYTGALDHPTMQISLGNVACVLTITDVKFAFYDGIAINHISKYVPLQGIVLTGAFLPTPVAFYDAATFVSSLNPGTVVFYANTQISTINGTSFLTNFTIEFDYSSDVNVLGGGFQAQLALVTSNVVVNNIPAPEYVLNNVGSTLVVFEDFASVVQSVTGNINFLLPVGAQAGETYVIANTLTNLFDPALVQAAYNAGVPTPVPVGASFDIPGSSLNLVGATLPVSRYIIFQHTGAGSIRSYEVFGIGFNP